MNPTALADRLPTMAAADLTSLRANAVRLSGNGSSVQAEAAAELIPLIDSEMARRDALPKPAVTRTRAPAKKKLPPVTGHQTALAPGG